MVADKVVTNDLDPRNPILIVILCFRSIKSFDGVVSIPLDTMSNATIIGTRYVLVFVGPVTVDAVIVAFTTPSAVVSLVLRFVSLSVDNKSVPSMLRNGTVNVQQNP